MDFVLSRKNDAVFQCSVQIPADSKISTTDAQPLGNEMNDVCSQGRGAASL